MTGRLVVLQQTPCLRRVLLSSPRQFVVTAALLALTPRTVHSFASLSTPQPRGGAIRTFAATTAPSGLTQPLHPSFLSVLRGGAVSTSTQTWMSTTAPEKIDTAASMTPAEKVEALRAQMKEQGLDVYLIPTDDPHLSEYTPEAYKRRGFLTGFHGSAGTAVVTADQACLWTDSRYWNEASMNLDATVWTLQKQGQPTTPTIQKYLADLAVAKQDDGSALQIGLDPYVHAASFAKDVETALTAAAKEHGTQQKLGELVKVDNNLVDGIWGEARPAVPKSAFRVHPLEYAGMSVAEKITAIRSQMQDKKATLTVFSTLDDVAYLLNMRAMGDIDTCPVGIAYATVSLDTVTLYCDEEKVQEAAVQEHLADVTIKPYDAIVADIVAHCQEDDNDANDSKKKVWLDASRANLALASAIPADCLLDSQNAVTPMKACKNEAELEGMRRAHLVDGAAMAEFMAWLTATVKERPVSEVEIDERLTARRAAKEGFLEVSFPTIAGVGSNGAIVHYRASPDSDLMQYLDTTRPILIDSGGQYTYGTTDVTRTWFFGKTPETDFQEAYTRVLKGHIGVDQMIFPESTPGFVLDVFARRHLWEAGLDYGHGTGHGVGAALNVHEGPMSISPRWTNKEFLKQGMVVSNEPGYYEDGNFGVRIENLLEIQAIPRGEDDRKKKEFFRFGRLTMIPIQKNLIDLTLMTDQELDWLDAYHAEVLQKVGPLLEPDSPAMAWLTASCEKVSRK